MKKLYWLLLNWYAQVVDISLDNIEELFDAMLPGTAGKVVLDFSYKKRMVVACLLVLLIAEVNLILTFLTLLSAVIHPCISCLSQSVWRKQVGD